MSLRSVLEGIERRKEGWKEKMKEEEREGGSAGCFPNCPVKFEKSQNSKQE